MRGDRIMSTSSWGRDARDAIVDFGERVWVGRLSRGCVGIVVFWCLESRVLNMQVTKLVDMRNKIK